MSSDDPADVDVEPRWPRSYRDPPEAFVAGRNGLAKSLRAAKRRDEAAAVAKLRRPVPPGLGLQRRRAPATRPSATVSTAP